MDTTDKMLPNPSTLESTTPMSCSSVDIPTSDTDTSSTSAKAKPVKRTGKKVKIK